MITFRSIGKYRLPGTRKTVEGLTASIIAQLLFIIVLHVS